MNNEIKSIQIVDAENLIKELNSKFKNLDKIYKIFEEEVGNNKWISIPNKNLYFNKEIMACYPNFLNNFQNIDISTIMGYEKSLKIIKENQEYSKYGIDWDIQTYNESINSFHRKKHPMDCNHSYHAINNTRWTLAIKNANNNIYCYNNDTSSSPALSSGNGLLVPIYRLGFSKDYELLEQNNTFFNYSIEIIFKIFLEKEFIMIVI
jgi:hypothetical protein